MSRRRSYAGLVPLETARWCEALLVEHDGGSRRRLDQLDRRWFRLFAEGLQCLMLPGILAHYELRKRCIAQLARQALRDGVTQAVVLGAGFDPLARQLHDEFPGVSFWEIDHPATQRVKAYVCGPGAPRLHFVGCDFAHDSVVSTLLAGSGFDPQKSTLWIAEGLLMYFPAATIVSLFKELRQASAPGSRFVFTFMEKPTAGRTIRFRRQSRLVDAWLASRREIFSWAESPDALPAFMALLGFRVDRSYAADELRLLVDKPRLGLAEGEWIADAAAI